MEATIVYLGYIEKYGFGYYSGPIYFRGTIPDSSRVWGFRFRGLGFRISRI